MTMIGDTALGSPKNQAYVPVVVTELEYRKAAATFETDAAIAGLTCIPAPADEIALANVIREVRARHAIVGVTRYTGALYDAIPPGGVIARFGVGHDNLDKVLARNRGILCCNTPGVLDDSVAECCIGLMIAGARHISALSSETQAGKWVPRPGTELHGKRLAIIGCGAIGRKVATIAKAAFGMHVTGYSPRKAADTASGVCNIFDFFTQDFCSAVCDADIVSLHIPDVPNNRDFINAERLRMMKPSALFINTARGAVADEDALFDALTSGVIAGAALDVFKQEPYLPQNHAKDLRKLPHTILTPHISSSTHEACHRMALAALRNIRLAIQGNTTEMSIVYG